MHYFQLTWVRAEQMIIKGGIKRCGMMGQIRHIIQHFCIQALIERQSRSQTVTAQPGTGKGCHARAFQVERTYTDTAGYSHLVSSYHLLTIITLCSISLGSWFLFWLPWARCHPLCQAGVVRDVISHDQELLHCDGITVISNWHIVIS